MLLGYGLALVTIVILAFYWLFLHRSLRRRSVLARPFPKHWRQGLERDMALYRKLPSELRERVHQNTLLMLDEVNFYGCAGQTITEPMKVLISAHAALLVSGLSVDYYQRLTSILVYPGAYRSEVEWQEGEIARVEEQERLGESWDAGRVILGWDQLAREAADPDTPTNVMLHEFAHQLDQLDGAADGVPPLDSGVSAENWHQVFSDAWHRLQDSPYDSEGVIDDYGATDPAEFFAVVTEAFFLTPVQLRQQEPDLYQCLSGFYQLSPADWEAATQT